MTKDEIKDEIKRLQAKLGIQNGPFVPDEGEDYCTLILGLLKNEGTALDIILTKTGLAFRTQKEANDHDKMMDLAVKIKKQAFTPDWDNVHKKYGAYWIHFTNCINVEAQSNEETYMLNFETRAKALAAYKGVSKEDFLYMRRNGLA